MYKGLRLGGGLALQGGPSGCNHAQGGGVSDYHCGWC